MPEWLPDSTTLNLRRETTYASIDYKLEAKLVSAKERAKSVETGSRESSVRYLRPIILAQPNIVFPPLNLTQTMQHSVGGFFGMGKTAFCAHVTFERIEFYANQRLSLTMNCDNSKCSKKIKSFKIKLFRAYQVRTNSC